MNKVFFNYYFNIIIFLSSIFLLSCKIKNKGITNSKNSVVLTQNDAGDHVGANNRIFSSLEKLENYCLGNINKRIKVLKNKKELSVIEKQELEQKTNQIKKFKSAKQEVEKCFNKTNKINKTSSNKNIKKNAMKFISNFCKEFQNVKAKNSKTNKNLTSLKDCKNIEEYLEKTLKFQKSNNNTPWNNFINENITRNFQNILEAAKRTIKKDKNTNNNNSKFLANIDESINASKKFMNAYLDLAKNEEINSKILNQIKNNKNKTKFINIINLTIRKFENKVIKPFKKSLEKLKNDDKISSSKKINAINDFDTLLNIFKQYKTLFKNYKNIDPKGEGMKKLINSLYKKNNDFSIPDSALSTIVFILELKNILTIALEEVNDFKNKTMKNKIFSTDEKWKKGIENMTNYITACRKIEQLKNFIKKSKLKIKNISNQKSREQINMLLELSKKENELALKFLKLIKENKELILKII